ncbi:hypothetical protein [Pseudocolwellia agarivorans]|nr:hypothetical protein [Pseudocolwellia agarivorans]
MQKKSGKVRVSLKELKQMKGKSNIVKLLNEQKKEREKIDSE